MKATHIYTDSFDTNRKLANRALKAMSDICGFDNGTIRNPYELASSSMRDGRTLIQTIYEDGHVMYNDGWFIVEVDDCTMYVDFTGFAVSEMIKNNEIPADGSYEYVLSEGIHDGMEEDEEEEVEELECEWC